MRYPASEKLEIIRLVEQSHLPVRRTLEKLGILPARRSTDVANRPAPALARRAYIEPRPRTSAPDFVSVTPICRGQRRCPRGSP